MVRWGIVGTGAIAGWMAGAIGHAQAAGVAAVASRRMQSAREFAAAHGAPLAFDSWAELCRSDAIDAVYVATPTGVREDICLAAIAGGKHVLGEKPFASLASVRRITAACRDNDVAFMDGTHFVHHPRSRHLQEHAAEMLGRVLVVESTFHFNLRDKSDIRYDTGLEPMGAIGDAGWYNMRAAVEYLAADAELESVRAYLRRDTQSGAATGGSGALRMHDGSTATWSCGFDVGGVVKHLRISGTAGVCDVDDFLGQKEDDSADIVHRRGGWDDAPATLTIESHRPGAVLMFEAFAAAVADASLRERWMTATERTQALLDAAWASACDNETG